MSIPHRLNAMRGCPLGRAGTRAGAAAGRRSAGSRAG